MGKYKVLTPLFKLSNQKNYEVGDDIELTEKEATPLIKEGRIAENGEPNPIKKQSKK